MKKLNYGFDFSSFEKSVINLIRKNMSLSQKLSEKEHKFNDQTRNYCLQLISLVDTFDLKFENYNERVVQNKVNESELKVINSFDSIKRKILRILESYEVKEIELIDNKVTLGNCKIIETKPDPTKKDGTILYTLKKGYLINNQILRPAEVISVKN